MEINKERLIFDLKELKKITKTPGEGVTRFSYSKEDKLAREYIISEASSAGFEHKVDALGNIYIGHFESKDESGLIRIGSHIDTVRNGGWLDGIYGVTGGLEVMRTIFENDPVSPVSKKYKNVELVIFAEEEGSNFGSSMTGSKFVTGDYGEEDLDNLKNDQGISMREILRGWEFPTYIKDEVVWDFSRIKAMLEIHIEQGPVLDEKKIPIGIVDWVNGMSVYEFTIIGVGNHAGGSPMKYRKDALVAASLCITAAEEIARADEEGVAVATVGKINVFPNCSNVIPEKVVFSLEVRDKDLEKINNIMDTITGAIMEICQKRELECTRREVARSLPIRFDEKIRKTIEEQAIKKGVGYQIINSGAVHDTCMIANHAPGGMIFVPSINGRSHVPFEDTWESDLALGAQLLLETVLALGES